METSSSSKSSYSSVERRKGFQLQEIDAVQLNRNLLRQLQEEFEQNPTIDLLFVIPEAYHQKHKSHLDSLVSDAARHNQRTLDGLQTWLGIDLPSKFPPAYARRKRAMVHATAVVPKRSKPSKLHDFRSHLNDIETATIVHAPSDEVGALLSQAS